MSGKKRSVVAMGVLCALGLTFVFASGSAETRLYDQVSQRIDSQVSGVQDPSFAPVAKGFSSDSARLANVVAAAKGSEVVQKFEAVGAGAKSFFPKDIEEKESNLRALDDKLNMDTMNNLLAQFKAIYPDVTYDVDWKSNVVNAQAWRSWFGFGPRHVRVFGGLVRHKAVSVEGVSLVLAHETGHHYGGKPTYPGSRGLSCEGQADYWGVKVGLHQVWDSSSYYAKTTSAIEQMDNFFSQKEFAKKWFEDQSRDFAANGDCGHPPPPCRKATYEAARDDQPKPECAGPASLNIARTAPDASGQSLSLVSSR